MYRQSGVGLSSDATIWHLRPSAIGSFLIFHSLAFARRLGSEECWEECDESWAEQYAPPSILLSQPLPRYRL